MLVHNASTTVLCLVAGLWLAVGATPTALLAAFVGGAVSWTLVEYVVHRWVFHDLFPASHAKHHLHPREIRYLHGPTHVVFGTWASAMLVYIALLGPGLGCVAVAGLNLAFLGFELLHAHVHREGGHWLLRRARTWHALHHRRDDGAQVSGFGFVSPFWDLCFGTWPDRAPLPRWLVLALPVPLPLLHFAVAAMMRRRDRVAEA